MLCLVSRATTVPYVPTFKKNTGSRTSILACMYCSLHAVFWSYKRATGQCWVGKGFHSTTIGWGRVGWVGCGRSFIVQPK